METPDAQSITIIFGTENAHKGILRESLHQARMVCAMHIEKEPTPRKPWLLEMSVSMA
jgi:hypothetical protein